MRGAEHQPPDEDQQHPQNEQRQIEAAEEFREIEQDAGAGFGDDRGDRRADRDRRQLHHIAGDVEHHVRDAVGEFEQRLAALAERHDRDAGEHREHDDLQDLAVGERLEDRGRHQMVDEIRRC